MERFNPGNGHLGAEADQLTSSGAPEPILFLPLSFGLSLTPKTPAEAYRVCELVGNELAHQGNGCGAFLPNLEEERQT